MTGALFIRINNRVNILRKKLLINKVLKVIESIALIILTVTVMYVAVIIKYYSSDNPSTDSFVCEEVNKNSTLSTR
jgi:hypothetical protein